MTYEPSKEAVKAVVGILRNFELTAIRTSEDDLVGAARAALIAAHEAEQGVTREVTGSDVHTLLTALEPLLDQSKRMFDIIETAKNALEAVEAHRAKKG